MSTPYAYASALVPTRAPSSKASRGHVRVGSHDRRHGRQRVIQLLADPKVRELAAQAVLVRDEHVLRLQVAVDDAVRVEVRESRGDVARDVEDVLVVEGSARVAVNNSVEVAGHQLGDDVEPEVRDLAHAVDDQQVLVGQFRHDHQILDQVGLEVDGEAGDLGPLRGDLPRPPAAATEAWLLIPRAAEDDRQSRRSRSARRRA